MHWPKHCEYNNKDEDNSLNTLNDKNYQASSQKLHVERVFFKEFLHLHNFVML